MNRHRKNSGSATTAILGVVVGIVLIVVGIGPFSHFEPQLLQGIDLNLGKTLAAMGVVLVLLPVLDKLFFSVVRDAINERNSELERTFTEADDLRARMEQMRVDYERRLAETEALAREQIQAQIKEAQALRQGIMAEATAKADDVLRKAQDEIASERQRLFTELRVEVVNLTLTATEKLLGENVDTEKNRRLVEEFVNKVEVPG